MKGNPAARELIRFCIMLAFFSTLVFGLLNWLSMEIPVKFRYENWWKIQLLFIFITLGFHYGLLIAAGKRAQSVTLFYMAGTTMKLLLFAGILIGYALLHKETAKAFVLSFILLYVLYTVFEVAVLYKKFNTDTGSGASKT